MWAFLLTITAQGRGAHNVMIHETPFGIFEVRWGSSGLPEHFPPPAKVRGYDDLVPVEMEPIVLPCPLYGERKRLFLYTLRSDPECLLLFSEHTPGVYAQGTLIRQREGGGSARQFER